MVFIAAFMLQLFIERGLKNDNSGEYKVWNDMLHGKINADILVIGSSRAQLHISPYYIDSTFKVNSYNIGIGGYGFLMQYYRFLFYMEYNKLPKYIIQNIDPTMTLAKGDSLYQYTQFLPYLKDSIIKKMVNSYYGLTWADFHIPLYKYHSLYSEMYSGIMANLHTPPDNNGSYKGFIAVNKQWDFEFGQFKLKHPHGYRFRLDKTTIDLFAKYLGFCKTKGITVIFVCTPEYYEAQNMLLNRDSIMNIYKNYSATYGIPILDYSKDSLCLDTINFYNSQHLNSMGAMKFNKKLVKDLKGIIPIPFH
jgi:hypothetical protein